MILTVHFGEVDDFEFALLLKGGKHLMNNILIWKLFSNGKLEKNITISEFYDVYLCNFYIYIQIFSLP